MQKKSYYLTLGIALLVLPTYCTANDEVPDKDLHQFCLYPTILIKSEDESSFGSGTIIKSSQIEGNKYINYIVSSNHVISSENQYLAEVLEYQDWSFVSKRKSFKLYHYAHQQKSDLYIGFFVSENKMPTATMDFDTKLYIGTNLYGIGCGLGDDPRVEEGKVSSPKMKRQGGTSGTVRAGIHTVPGDSGGGVFTQKYKIIGVTKAIKIYKEQYVFNVRYFVPLTEFKVWEKDKKLNFSFMWEPKEKPPILEYYKEKLVEEVEILN